MCSMVTNMDCFTNYDIYYWNCLYRWILHFWFNISSVAIYYFNALQTMHAFIFLISIVTIIYMCVICYRITYAMVYYIMYTCKLSFTQYSFNSRIKIDNTIQIIIIIVTFILYILVKLPIHFTEIIYLYLFGTYSMFATTGNYFNIIIIQCVNVTQLILYTCISLDVFPEFSNHALIYFCYKGILLILFDKLLNNLCECICCICNTIMEGQFRVFQIIYFLYLLYTEIRPYVWHRFLFICFSILITCKFICTGNENQLRNIDNTSPLNCRIIDYVNCKKFLVHYNKVVKSILYNYHIYTKKCITFFVAFNLKLFARIVEFITTYWNTNELEKWITHVHILAISFIILLVKLCKLCGSLCYSIMLNRVFMCTPPFTRTRINRGEGHLFEQLNIIPNITSNYTSLFIKHMYYAYTNILLYYHNNYYIGPYCIIVYIFLVNCLMTVRGRMACSLSCIYCILYYDDNIPLLKPNAHKLKNMYHHTLSPWNTKMYQTNCINTNTPFNSIVVAPVVRCHNVLRPHSSQSKKESHMAIHSACDSEDESQNIVIHSNCFNGPDPSTLGNIDPDIHYFRANNVLKTHPIIMTKLFKLNLEKISTSQCSI